MNTILLDWYSKGCASSNDVKALEAKRTNAKAAANSTPENSSHSYNIDLMFEHAMNTTPKLKK